MLSICKNLSPTLARCALLRIQSHKAGIRISFITLKRMASARSSTAVTGDMRNNIAKLIREVQRMKLKVEPNIRGLSLGLPSAFLPIIHAGLMSFSLPLAQHIASEGVELYGRSDLRFIDGLYKVVRDIFQYRPKISKEQFLTVGYAEHKVIMTFDLLKYCQKKHQELSSVTRNVKIPHKTLLKFPNCKNSSINTPSQATVHTIAESAGIGSVWQLKPSKQTNNRSNRPISPPPSPLSPSIVQGPPIIPEPQLELTPESTPLKPHSRNTKHTLHQISQLTNIPMIDHTHQSCDKNVHVLVDESNGVNGEIVTVGVDKTESEVSDNGLIEYEEREDKEETGCSKFNVSSSLPSSQEEDLISQRTMEFTLSVINDKLEDIVKVIERMSGRLVIVETQLKIIEERDNRESAVTKGTCTTQDAETQTDSSFKPEKKPKSCLKTYSTDITSEGTTHIKSDVPTPLLKPLFKPKCIDFSPDEDIPYTPFEQSKSLTSFLATSSSTPRSYTPIKIDFTTPTREKEKHTSFRTPEETREVIQKLNSRVQQTKDLLSKVHTTQHLL